MFWNNVTCFYHFGNIVKQCDMFLSLRRSFEIMRCVSITLAIFWNYATRFYHFGDLLKLCDAFLSLWRSFETMRRVSITLAIHWNNAMRIYHFGDLLKQCDAFLSLGDPSKQCNSFLSLWRSFETMRRVSITLAIFWNNATRIYHLGDVLYSNRTISSRLE